MNGVQKIKIFDREYDIEDGFVRSDSLLSVRRDVGAVPFFTQYIKTVTMCVHISPRCNLACKYCFKKVDGDLSFGDIQRFIDIVLQLYPRADRYIVDMSGSGEPLLQMDMILRVADYCRELSDKYCREFLPTLVTNGTLLDKDNVEKLQSGGVLFGVSLDGPRDAHDKNRVFKNGKGSFDTVKANVSAIEHKDFVGAAVTYSDGRLKEAFLTAYELLPTVSMKPVRASGGGLDAEDICAGYDELISFLIDKTLRGETEYIFSLLNGDDYFGKFFKRIALGTNVYGRCDAGLGRFALAGDKKIYCCPAATGITDGAVGDLEYGIRFSRIFDFWKSQRNDFCEKCYARHACGGECKIVSYEYSGSFDKCDPAMCKIKRHIYLLAVYFADTLREKAPCIWLRIKSFASKVESYYLPDTELIDAVMRSDGKYTFSELKKLKDNDKDEFYRIYASLRRNAV